jgi:RimJ/RimL family protein N-acetyltransferase
MLSDDPDKPEYFLWRFMIAHEHQGKAFGAQAIRLVTDHVRTRPNATRFLTSVVPGEGSPQRFYEKQGFKLTGAEEEGELVMAMEL